MGDPHFTTSGTWENSEKYRKFGKILGKIRKNTKNSEKYFVKFGKIDLEKWKKFGKIEKNRKNRKNSEKYFQKFGKILVGPKKKRSSLKFGGKIRKNTENSEKC